MTRLLIIDGLNIVRRLYAALPTPHDEPPNIEQFLSSCVKIFKHLLQQHQPSHAVAVFENYHTTWRHQLFPPYKANRKPQPEAMLASFVQLQNKLQNMGLTWLQVPNFEADDVIATIAHKASDHACTSLIISGDHLIAQILGTHIGLYDHFNQHPIDADFIDKRYGIKSWQLADYFALVGSSSVNVPGIKGIGAATATALLTTHKDCDALIKAQNLDAKATGLLADKEYMLYLFRYLFTLKYDCSLHANLIQWQLKSFI